MTTRDVADTDVRAIVHVAGPAEAEADDSPLGYVYVQRCLRCDELLAIWRLEKPPGNAFRLGRLIAVDPYTGIRGGREAVDRIDDYDRACMATPVSWL